MDQRIGQKDAPLHTAASMDPGFIPGITPAGPAGDAARAKEHEESDAVEESVDSDTAAADVEETKVEESGVDTEVEAPDEASDEAEADDDSEKTAADDDSEASGEAGESAEPVDLAKSGKSGDSPVFEARDHRGAITVDASGISFTLDDQATDFSWDEVVAVEQSTARFAKRLTVTVHTKGNRWYPNEVQAPDRATLTRWTGELDDALDAYFEE
ncbi:hypothetical protein G6045_25070 [Streptomyces sp. YC504]|uniref:Uncharacterized protein n=1 Tax=Streptomyces mesophilus TaxID=1775132 RepID=A0A6G4XMX5_9ACTN|nr:hypothetical protein [Streptomyces mesophilus]NGO78905.1 hypothetical protein [Streptomyces mesophilus]